MGNIIESCFGESKRSRVSRAHRRSTRAESRVVKDNIMQNMRSEFDEHELRQKAINSRSRNSLHNGRRGSNASMMSRGRRMSIRDRKSVILDANESLRNFALVDIDKSSDLKKLKEREEQRKSKLNIINRRMSVSTPDLVLGAPKGGNQAVLTIPNNKSRRLSLCVPDDDAGGGAGGRRVSIGGRRNSTVFNFDPRQLPNTMQADLLKQPKKSALRRPSFVEHFAEEEEATVDDDSD